jgi:hypothetical protein
MDFAALVNENETIRNLHDDGPNFPYSRIADRVMNKNSRPNALIVLIQIERTEFHIDKGVRRVWKVSKLKNFDDMLMSAITELFNRS